MWYSKPTAVRTAWDACLSRREPNSDKYLSSLKVKMGQPWQNEA